MSTGECKQVNNLWTIHSLVIISFFFFMKILPYLITEYDSFYSVLAFSFVLLFLLPQLYKCYRSQPFLEDHYFTTKLGHYFLLLCAATVVAINLVEVTFTTTSQLPFF